MPHLQGFDGGGAFKRWGRLAEVSWRGDPSKVMPTLIALLPGSWRHEQLSPLLLPLCNQELKCTSFPKVVSVI